MPTAHDLVIEPLTPDRFGDLATLFDQGGDPKWCWCTFFRYRGRDWTNATAEGNRADLEQRSHDTPPAGLIAFRDLTAVGWVSLGPRETYGRLTHAKVLAPVDDTPVWSIVCFVVARTSRGQGVATALLDAAVEHARSSGATHLEAYPVDTDGQRIPSANVYHGTLAMFEAAGFKVVARRQANATTAVRPIVRLAL